MNEKTIWLTPRVIELSNSVIIYYGEKMYVIDIRFDVNYLAYVRVSKLKTCEWDGSFVPVKENELFLPSSSKIILSTYIDEFDDEKPDPMIEVMSDLVKFITPGNTVFIHVNKAARLITIGMKEENND